MRVSLEEFSTVIRAIHAAAASPDRWPDAQAAVARLVNYPEAAGGREWQDTKQHGLGFPGAERIARHASEPSIERLTALLEAHFQIAREIQNRLAEALLGRLARASLDRLATAAFVLDRLGTVYHCNAAARGLPKDDYGVQLVHSRFRLRDPKLNAAIRVALGKATQEPPCLSILPLRSSEERICEIAISPLPADQAGSACEPLALLVIGRPQHDENRIFERVRTLYGLTRAEARVMAALTLGTTVEEIAAKHRVRPSTVRAQVRSLFDKTGAKRQSDLVRLALNGVPLVTELNY